MDLTAFASTQLEPNSGPWCSLIETTTSIAHVAPLRRIFSKKVYDRTQQLLDLECLYLVYSSYCPLKRTLHVEHEILNHE